MTGPVMGNPLKAIGTAVPERIREAREERSKLVARVLELNLELASLETIQLVGGEAAGPVLQGLEEASHPVPRRSRVEPRGAPSVADPPSAGKAE